MISHTKHIPDLWAQWARFHDLTVITVRRNWLRIYFKSKHNSPVYFYGYDNYIIAANYFDIDAVNGIAIVQNCKHSLINTHVSQKFYV